MTTSTFDQFPASLSHPAPRRARAPVAFQALLPKRLRTVLLFGGIVALHGVVALSLSGGKQIIVAPKPVPVTVVFVPPEVTPPPPPDTALPRVATAAPPVFVPPQVAIVTSAAPVFAVTTSVAPAASVAPPVQAAQPAAPPPAVEEPVTEPRGYAGYLKNPAPDYPLAAQKRGLEGQVVLKVHVLASGQPDSVAVARSSGHPVLDEAALKAVWQWAFAPARRGKSPIDGWVQVPLNFRI